MSSSDEEEVFFIAALLEEEENEEKHRKSKRRRFSVHPINKGRQLYGEFHTLFNELVEDDRRFFQYFRMSHEKFCYLLNVLIVSLQKKNTIFGECIGPKERLVVCLRFLATGNSFKSLSFSYRLGESTIREIVYSTCEAIWTLLQPKVMPVPKIEIWKRISDEFYNKWNFPNALVAIDGKHILIQAPPHSGSNYFCYKKHFSTVLLALVDANYRFISIDVGSFGKNSDSGIFNNSPLGKALRNQTLDIPMERELPGTNEKLPYVIIGDEAFPLGKHLMRPYSGRQIQGDETKKIFNYRLSRARNPVENSFGILVRKFRIFERRLSLSPEHVTTVVLAVCCLHNYLRNDACYWTEVDLNYGINDARGMRALRRIGGAQAATEIEIRNRFKDYFVSPEGAVGWQQRRIREGMQLPIGNV